MADSVVSYMDCGIAVDDRGLLTFANGFDMARVRRFYTVQNHTSGFVRGWHAHKREEKFIFPVSGSAVVAAVEVDDWENPSPDLVVTKHIVSSITPRILHVPGGFAHGFKTLSPDTSLMFFSTSTLEESADDDYRYEAYYWDAWNIVER